MKNKLFKSLKLRGINNNVMLNQISSIVHKYIVFSREACLGLCFPKLFDFAGLQHSLFNVIKSKLELLSLCCRVLSFTPPIKIQQEEEEYLTLITSLDWLQLPQEYFFNKHFVLLGYTSHYLYPEEIVCAHYARLSSPSAGCITSQRHTDIMIIIHYTHHYPC